VGRSIVINIRSVQAFRQMLASHQRSLNAASEHNEPIGQIASRELEIVKIKGSFTEG
jgi:hypothetical protein